MKLFRWLRNLYWGNEGTPEDKLAQLEAKQLKQELKRQARVSGRGRLPRV